jgi:alpha-galactosidase/6-phospho-beta-glucosidase family protein
VFAEQRRHSRAAQLRKLSETALACFADGGARQIEACLDARPAPWYSHALAPYLESLVTRTSALHFFFSDANAGWHREFADDDVLEFAHRWDHGELARKPVRLAPPHELLMRLRPLVHYERQAAQAVLLRSRAALRHALSAHPWVCSTQAAGKLASAMFAGHRRAQANLTRPSAPSVEVGRQVGG